MQCLYEEQEALAKQMRAQGMRFRDSTLRKGSRSSAGRDEFVVQLGPQAKVLPLNLSRFGDEDEVPEDFREQDPYLIREGNPPAEYAAEILGHVASALEEDRQDIVQALVTELFVMQAAIFERAKAQEHPDKMYFEMWPLNSKNLAEVNFKVDHWEVACLIFVEEEGKRVVTTCFHS